MRILIIGAGPAGSSTAISILRNNPDAKVTLIDHRRIVGVPPRCAGGVSTYMLGKIGLKIPSKYVASPITRIRIYAPNQTFYEVSSNGSDYGYVLYRDKFDQYLASQAIKLGAELIQTHYTQTVGLIEKMPDFIIDARGYAENHIGVLKQNVSREDLHFCLQNEVYWNHPKGLVSIYFDTGLIPHGYGWVFPSGQGRARIGLGTPISLKQQLHARLKQFKERIGADACPVENLVGKVIPTAPPRRSNVTGNRIFVGDAGAWCDPLTGGGICQAIASGTSAGRAIAEGRPELYDYYMNWLRTQNKIRYRLKKVLCSFSDQDFNTLIASLQDFEPSTLDLGTELRRVLRHMAPRNLRLFAKMLGVMLLGVDMVR